MNTTNGDGGAALSLREVQLAILHVFDSFSQICRREGFRFWLAYGSLLGAVRHKGFIPWDDDLDVQMPRDDYEAFMKYCRTHVDDLEPLVVLCGIDDPHIPFLITRMSDTRYRVVGEYGCVVDNLGAFIDIYPLDGSGTTIEEAMDIEAKANHLLRDYKRSNALLDRIGLERGTISPLRARAKQAYRRLFLQSRNYYVEELIALAKSEPFNESEYVNCLIWDPLFKPRELYDDIIETPFENISAPIPARFDDLLSWSYGEYMKLPPEEEQVGHHTYSLYYR